jgi:acyl-CoA synthetase (AMP-forming)/AMP-acid ligase II
MPRIIPVRGLDELVFERVRDIRAAGDVPLVGDERWPDGQWDAMSTLVERMRVPDAAAWATLTSGSTGFPRILLRTQESWQASFPAVSALLGADEDDGVALPAPSSSSLTLFSMAHALASGPRPVLGPDGRTGNGASCFHGTPQALRRLLDAGGPTGVRTALVGGSSLDLELRAEAEGRGIRVVSYYGAAELSFVAIDDGTGLRPFPGVEVDVRDGELWVRSPFVAIGYLGEGGPMRRDGDWTTVGDLADVTDGALRLRGRADGAILTASATVIPEEVEAALRALPGVADAVVVGLPAPGVGALVAALVEPETSIGDARQLRVAAARVLTPASRPRAWFAGELPRTAAGKPARAEALRRVLAGEVSRLAG